MEREPLKGLGYKVREAVTEVMRLLYERGLVSVLGGNVSARLVMPGGLHLVYITPSSAPKHRIRPEDVAVVDLEGVVHEGKPSIEYRLHLEVYRRRSEVMAVVHAHSPCTVAAARVGLLGVEALTLEARYYLGGCLEVVPPLEPGSLELAEEAAKALEKCDVVVLKEHGVVAVASGGGNPLRALYEALNKVEVLESSARVALVTALLSCRKAGK